MGFPAVLLGTRGLDPILRITRFWRVIYSVLGGSNMHPDFRPRPFVFACLMACSICIGAFGSAFGAQKAPDFTLPDLSGNKVTLEQYRGSVVILDFWAIWCVPCLKSIPQMVQLQEKYKDKGLVVLGISLDDPRKMDDLSLLEFKKRRKINYPILRGTEQVTDEYFRGIRLEIPTLFIIDRDGMIVERHKGFELEEVEKALQKLL